MQRKTKARAAALVTTVLALALVAHCAGILDVAAPEVPPLGWDEAGGSDGSHHGARIQAHEASGVQARAIDPALARIGWTAADVDPELLDAALRRPIWGTEAAILDLQANADMVAWLQGFAGDDEFGQAVAECRRRYERSQPRPCVQEQDVVVRRDPQGEASVVAVVPRLPDDPFGPPGEPSSRECRAWAQCAAHAWEGRPGRFPQGAGDRVTTGDDGSELIAIRTYASGMTHLDAHGIDLSTYLAIYEDDIQQLEVKIRMREQAYVDAEEEGVRSRAARESLFHNLLLDRGKLEDARAYLRYLYMHEGGS
jgi:hypothetical protein